MAIKVNEAGESNFKLFTGVANLNVVAINPSQDELKQMGFKAEKAPEYKTVGENKDKVKIHKMRIDIYLEGKHGEDVIKVKHAIFLTSEVVKELFIDNFGKFSKDKTKLSNEGLRNPYDGEVELLLFLAQWLNVGKGEELYLETLKEIIGKGITKELRGYVAQAKANQVKGLLGVRDGKYQQLYPKKIERSYTKDLSWLWKNFVSESKYVKGFFGEIDMLEYNSADFVLREYNAALDNSNSAAPTSGSVSGGSEDFEDVEMEVVDEDDVPF